MISSGNSVDAYLYDAFLAVLESVSFCFYFC